MGYVAALQTHFPEVADHIRRFLQDVLEHTAVSATEMKEILAGAFTVIVGDGGYFHDKYAPHHYVRVGLLPMSSHGAYLARQYRMGARSIVSCGDELDCSAGAVAVNPHFDVLVGVDAAGDTAFQFERSRRDTVPHALKHATDFLAYAGTKQRVNLGAFGTSPYVDSKPLRLLLCTAVGRVCKPIPER